MRPLLLFALLGTTLFAQQTPTFRAESRLVELNVVVTGKGDAPVLGLTEADFRILENGQPQTIAFFAAPAKAPPQQPEPLPPGLFTNRPEYTAGAPQGVTAIVLDVLNTGAADQVFARSHLARFLANLKSDDIVAVYLLSDRLRVVHDFSDDRKSLEALVNKLRTRLPGSGIESEERFLADARLLGELIGEESFDESGGAAASGDYQRMRVESRTEGTMNLLEQLAQHLAGVPGRKSLVWFGSGLPMTIMTFSPGWNGGRGMAYSINNAAKFRNALRDMANANVAIYPVDPRGLQIATVFPTLAPNWRRPSAGPSAMPREWLTAPSQETFTAMETFAKETGGRATFNSNDLEGALRRAADDLKTTYTLAYYTSLDDAAAKRELTVKVTRPNVDVLARRKVPVGKRDAVLDARALLESPLSATGILLNSRVTRQEEKLHVAVQIEPASLLLTRNGNRTEGIVEIYLAQIKPSGERNVTDARLELRLSESQLQKIVDEGLVYNRILPVSPEVERLRILVRDPRSGAAGSFDVPLRMVPAQP
ncbi:MAG: VWA domain-containing protein [Bryobacterales bacterium]|nr:VWA domain-containing protein [Bryobacterales bacterium]